MMRKGFTLPILGWEVFDTSQGWRLRFPDGREDWPTPRERQIILAFRDYAAGEPVGCACPEPRTINLEVAGCGICDRPLL